MGIQDQRSALAKFRKSNDAVRADLPGVAENFDNLVELVAAWQSMPQLADRERIIKVGVFAGGVALAFPPFYFQGANGIRLGLGHSFILSPPTISKGSASVGTVDGIGLLAILGGIALITWAATLVRWTSK